MKRQNPNHRAHHRAQAILDFWAGKPWMPKDKSDNRVKPYQSNLEQQVREAIQKEFEDWKRPYRDYEGWDYENNCSYLERIELPCEDSIRDRLQKPDVKFPKERWARKVRVPSLKRSDREWENFYNTFPELGIKVALGKRRYHKGAKLKYIPLFEKILNEEWPIDAKRWTEKQYQKQIQEGKIKP